MNIRGSKESRMYMKQTTRAGGRACRMLVQKIRRIVHVAVSDDPRAEQAFVLSDLMQAAQMSFKEICGCRKYTLMRVIAN
jgi:hypothetical protein